MDGKKTKRRRSVAKKRHGSMEEKPKSSEVMNEKEKQDRMEAASVLSSLMFLPPKSSKDGDGADSCLTRDQDTPSLPVLNSLGSLQSLSGIPPVMHVTPSRPKLGRPPKAAARNMTIDERNKMILAELENSLSQSLDNGSSISSAKSKPQITVKVKDGNSSKVQTPTLLNSNSGLPVTLSSNKQVPIPVMQQAHKQYVLKALLRNVMAKASAGRNESEVASCMETESVGEKCSSPNNSAVSNESEKMECDSTSGPNKKKDSSDTNLPLKKRRLVGMLDSSTVHSYNPNNIESVPSMGALHTSRQIENILQLEREFSQCDGKQTNSIISSHINKPEEGYRPVQVDPRKSLMVLSELKLALTPDEDGDLPLHIAVVHEDTEVVKKFVDIMLMSGKTVDRFNKLQQTPLHLAILVNQPEIVETLLSAGANPNLLDRHGCTTIHSSVCKQFDDCMNTVFRSSKIKINLNCRDYEGYYPLHTCVELDNIAMLQQLVQKGADVNAQDGKAGRSVLMYAVEYNRCNIVQYLIESGGNAELHNYAGVTPLMVAQAGKMDEMVNILNKALDIVKVEDQHYIPKKMPISRVCSRSDTPESQHSMLTNGIPLVYEEYERTRLDSEDGRHVFSHRSSTSSPIDLSMRGPSTQSPVPSTEQVVRGRPPRKKGKKENKAHREKHPMKSNLIEKHASIVAALEHKIEKSNESKLHSKHEFDRSNALKENSNAMTSLIMSAYAKQLMEKLSQAYRMQFKTDSSKNPVNISRETELESKNGDNEKQKTMKSTASSSDLKTVSQETGNAYDVYSIPQSENLNNSTSESTVGTNQIIDSKFDISDKSEYSEMKDDVEVDDADKEDRFEESMDVEDSPAMPVLSRATSECNDSNDNVINESFTSNISEPNSSTTPVLDQVQIKTINSDHTNDITDNLLEQDKTSQVNTEVKSLETVNNNHSVENKSCDSSDNVNFENMDRDSNVATIDLPTNYYNGSQSDKEHGKEFTELSDNNVESSCLSSVSKLNDIDDKCMYSGETHHSDDSMEVELSEYDKNKISSENIKLGFGNTIKKTSLNDSMSKIVESSYTGVDETNLVMDLDEDESELVIDETLTDGESETNKETLIFENHDKTVRNDNVSNVEDTSGNIDESNVKNTAMVMSDGIKNQKQATESSINTTEKSSVPEVSNRYSNITVSKQLEGSKDDVTSEQKTDGKKVLPKSINIVEASTEKPKTVPVSLVDSLLKTGQSHVLYYHDGDDYKPVRIFIDNSEQSSLVLKQMMQSAQFSTVNSVCSSSSVIYTGSNDLSSKLSTTNILNDQFIPGRDSPLSSVELGKLITDAKSGGTNISETADEQNSSYQNVFVKSLMSMSGTDSRKNSAMTKLTKQKTSPDRKKSDDSLNKSHTDSVKYKKKSVESDLLHSEAESTVQIPVSSCDNVTKTIPTMLNTTGKKYTGGQNLPGKSLGLSSIKTLYNEGTLTRVNPDIKSRLSKALQSSQRKAGPDKKDCESFSYGGVVSNFDGKYIPEVISTITTTTDTRQQM